MGRERRRCWLSFDRHSDQVLFTSNINYKQEKNILCEQSHVQNLLLLWNLQGLANNKKNPQKSKTGDDQWEEEWKHLHIFLVLHGVFLEGPIWIRIVLIVMHLEWRSVNFPVQRVWTGLPLNQPTLLVSVVVESLFETKCLKYEKQKSRIQILNICLMLLFVTFTYSHKNTWHQWNCAGFPSL